MNVLTHSQLASRLLVAMVLGSTITAATIVLLERRQSVQLGEPKIVKQTPSQTVARIPTLHAGVRVDCTVTIDQAKNIWSITC